MAGNITLEIEDFYKGDWWLTSWPVRGEEGGPTTCAASKISTKCPESPLQQLWRMCGHDIRSTIRANSVINFLFCQFVLLLVSVHSCL